MSGGQRALVVGGGIGGQRFAVLPLGEEHVYCCATAAPPGPGRAGEA